jgi:chromosomal replication initiator protein
MKDYLAILHLTAAHFNCQPHDIVDQKRPRDVVVARHALMKWLRDNTSLSLQSIGTLLGRDHGTVIFACNSIQDRLETDRNYRDALVGYYKAMEAFNGNGPQADNHFKELIKQALIEIKNEGMQL